jgi:phospholipid/cholesterol/gamma-HCH transport system substrate-binding protein
MPSSSPVAVRVGIFTVIGVMLLLFLSVSATKIGFGKRDAAYIANFPQATGLERGSRVTLRGVPVGAIEAMEWDARAFRVRVTLRVDRTIQVPAQAFAVVRPSSLLGGSLVDINFRDAELDGRFLVDGAEIRTDTEANLQDAIASIQGFGDEGRQLFANLNRDREQVIARVNALLDENNANIRATFESLGPKLGKVMEQVDVLVAGVGRGEGTLGALFKDDAMKNDLQKTVADIRQILADVQGQIDRREGTLAKLVFDDAIARNAEGSFAKLGDAADEIKTVVAENRVGIDRVVASMSNAAPSIETTMKNLEAITGKVNEGDGTLGKLVNDPALYNEARRAFNQIGESFEGSEEQGVIRSFFGVIFGALL